MAEGYSEDGLLYPADGRGLLGGLAALFRADAWPRATREMGCSFQAERMAWLRGSHYSGGMRSAGGLRRRRRHARRRRALSPLRRLCPPPPPRFSGRRRPQRRRRGKRSAGPRTWREGRGATLLAIMYACLRLRAPPRRAERTARRWGWRPARCRAHRPGRLVDDPCHLACLKKHRMTCPRVPLLFGAARRVLSCFFLGVRASDPLRYRLVPGRPDRVCL